MTFYDELNNLETLNGNIEKEEQLLFILQKFRNAEAFFRFAFNDQVFGVKEQTFKNAFSFLLKDNDTDDADEFNHVSDWLETTEYEPMANYTVHDLLIFGSKLLVTSGHDQEIHISNFIRQCAPIKKKWFCRAILKDLRCGVQVKTVNKCFRQLNLPIIKKFSLQLCDKIDLYDEEKCKQKLVFPCSMECKYDGIRLQAELRVKDVANYTNDPAFMDCILTSRRGKDKTNDYPEIVATLKKQFVGENIILDGEIISKSFQELTRKDSKATKKYVIFDLIVDEKLKYLNRYDNLKALCMEKGITDVNKDKNIIYNKNTIVLAEHYSCNNIQEAQEYYEALNERGEEGIIIKLDDRIYERGSRKHMFKCKKVFTADLLCYGFKLGEGKRSGKVATLCLQDKSKTINVDVGSGITDEICEDLTKQVDNDGGAEFIWNIVEIKYNEGSITKNGTKSLRFPRFVRFRESSDKDEPDDITDIYFR